MSKNQTFLGSSPLKINPGLVEGNFVEIDGESYYKISNVDRMRPFFVSLISHSDHWLFAGSHGGLSAGRKNEETALFPYYTDDKIGQGSENTGSKSIIKLKKGEKNYLWEPFSARSKGIYFLSNNVYKSTTGNKLTFEEVNHDLGLSFAITWQFSQEYGIVKESILSNLSQGEVRLDVLDGIQNIMPFGVSSDLQNRRSNLVNAYKKNELEEPSGLGLFLLSSMIVDKAEPSEALKTTSVFTIGIEPKRILLSSVQLDNFRQGLDLHTEYDVRAETGSYLVHTEINLGAVGTKRWMLAADVNQDHSSILSLKNELEQLRHLMWDNIVSDINRGTLELRNLVANADGLQLTRDRLSITRHYSNVMFNIARGGIFGDQYSIDQVDLLNFAKDFNKGVAESRKEFFGTLPSRITSSELIQLATETKDLDVLRICYEYLPLSFSRRHGDPSRPWNSFSIEITKEDGTKNLNYQGNWRDIFQNWEALGVSYPGFILSMITKFVNASTVDGYNPYRITRQGIDWEVIEPNDPWSYIGYWGDHQIIYLQKLMEVAYSSSPEDFTSLLTQSNFVYANVPYRIKPYPELVSNPQDTILFDLDLEREIEEKVRQIGADGKLVFDQKGKLIRANLMEKILVTLLAKLSNFVPEAGIWLNTQRPEWNDANNALVGNGVSMVTLYYMRRFVTFLSEVLQDSSNVNAYEVNSNVFGLFEGIGVVLSDHEASLSDKFSDGERREIVDALGQAGAGYREQVYRSRVAETEQISVARLSEFLSLTLKYLDHTIKSSKRQDGLYHAYNLIEFGDSKLEVSHLYEMLEGQVAVLSAGILTLEEVNELLDALKNSAVYRSDQYSYMLYPNRDLPRFLDKNAIPEGFIRNSKLVELLMENADRTIVIKDMHGQYHFNGSFNNASSLKSALMELDELRYGKLRSAELDAFLESFEKMFNHKEFTGRSGTFFGYEGLGSIYWHMVSKLLLAIAENIRKWTDHHAGSKLMGNVIDHYYEIRAGIGINKSPELYGAFPTDPYSHTPGNKGAQQPGMTGQVKEDILSRWAELGVVVSDSCIQFDPLFLNRDEFLESPEVFEYFDLKNNLSRLPLAAGQLGFTLCQVPVIYTLSSMQGCSLQLADGTELNFGENKLSSEVSKDIFLRSGRIVRIDVNIMDS